VRLAAARSLITAEPDPGLLPLLRNALEKEADADVRESLATVVAMADLGSDAAAVRLAAVDTLAGSLYPEVRARLQAVADGDTVPSVKGAAINALNSIQEKLAFYRFLENLFFGLSLGSVLLLAAIGLAITFGVMGVINMAHGELMMLGAYTAYVMQQLMPNSIGTALLLSLPAAFLVAGLVGIAIERGVIRFLYGRPLETLLATFGISLVLQQAVRSIFSPLNREVAAPAWMSGSLELNPVLALTWNRLIILVFALVVFAVILLVMKRTSLGLKLRAVAQNRAMARAVGVRASWVDALTFGLGSGIAGVAGVALSQLTNVGPNLGQGYIIDSFMVVVFGGVGNLWGTLVGAMGLGIVNKFLEPHAGAVLAKILVLVFIILFIQKRPRGLFPQKGRAAEA
jgi:urea transport system permease protein